jgi:hypothetical protein
MSVTSGTPFTLTNFFNNFLASVEISRNLLLRTNSAGMPGNRRNPGAAKHQGRRGGESESLEEEAIEIGNS